MDKLALFRMRFSLFFVVLVLAFGLMLVLRLSQSPAQAEGAMEVAEDQEPFKYNTTTWYQLKTLVNRRLLLVKKDPPSVIVQLVR